MSRLKWLLRARGNFLVAGIAALVSLCSSPTSLASFVTRTETEFLTSGDFNGDGITDVLVLDRATGNARIGYQDPQGSLTWSAPLPTGVPLPDGVTVGRFISSDRDAIAATSVQFNRVNVIPASNPTNGASPYAVTLQGVGPDLLVGLAAPYGTTSDFDSLLVGSSHNSTPDTELLEMLAFIGQAQTTYQDSAAREGYLASGNSIQLATPETLIAAMERGTNDNFLILSASNHFNAVLSESNLPPGTAYTYGRFNNEMLPRVFFYVPGQSNFTVRAILQGQGGFELSPPRGVSLGEAVKNIYYVSQANDGSAIIEFGDGVQGVRLPGGNVVLGNSYRTGAGAAGNSFTGVVPLGEGRFALLDGAGSGISTHIQVIDFDGTNFTRISSANLPSVSSAATRANIWLFQSEPFVTRSPGLIGSLAAPDWSDSISGLPGGLSARIESDGGAAAGLGSPATNNLGAPPGGSAYALANQYGDAISVFSYGAPQAAQPVKITISPPPGTYDKAVQISFSTVTAGDRVYYRAGEPDVWHLYGAPFNLTNDATVDYYGTDSAGNNRSGLEFASYSLGRSGAAPPEPLDLNGNDATNPAVPVLNTNLVLLSENGTVFYGRASADGIGTIWAINLDGSGDHYITTGARPRVSRDGRLMAFLRGGNPLVTQGNLWVRDLQTGAESLLFSNNNYTIGFDWDRTGTNLVFDWSCALWHISPGDTALMLPLTTDCYDDAPVVNPVDGRVAFHNLNSDSSMSGLFVVASALGPRQGLNVGIAGASWPAWSPDGQRLAFVDGNTSASAFTADGGKNVYTVGADGTALSQISHFTDAVNGFLHGVVWSPDKKALVGAGFVYGINGIWMIPMTPDGTDCAAPATRLPTTPGDPISWVGSIVTAPVQPLVITRPGLFIRREPGSVVVYWTTNFAGYTLESTTNLSATSGWMPVSGPFSLAGVYYEHQEFQKDLSAARFFRLDYTGAVVPLAAALSIHIESGQAVLNWPANLAGYTLEASTNFPAPTGWKAVSGPYPTAGDAFEYRTTVMDLSRGEYFRLRGP